LKRRKKNRRGRPHRWTREVALRIGLARGHGFKVDEAARFAGLGRSTFYRYLAAARAGNPEFESILLVVNQPPERSPFYAMFKGGLGGIFDGMNLSPKQRRDFGM
jgi:hypothetical protein